jgi:flavorubredoxin
MNTRTVNTGDSIGIGKRSLKFVLMPMVHWPDSMATYVPEEKMLLPNDAFGQHIATVERFADEIGWDIVREEAAKYYANIVMPYGRQVNEALKALSGLEIDMIAPSHGAIWREHLKDILALYQKWADNISDDKAVIVYDTMWGSTRKIAYAINAAFDEMGIPAVLADLGVTHISDVMGQVLGAKYIFIGSPTLNNGVLPTMASFLAYMKGLAPKNKIGLSYGSYGWDGQSISEIEAVMKGCGFEVMENIKVQYVPDAETLAAIKGKIKENIRKGV